MLERTLLNETWSKIMSKELTTILINLSDSGLNYQEISKLISESQTELLHHINQELADKHRDSKFKFIKSINKDDGINFYQIKA